MDSPLNAFTETRNGGSAGIPGEPPFLGYGFKLENELASELEYSWIVGAIRDPKIRARYRGAEQTAELGVIKRVETVDAELETSPLGEGKGLVYRSVEICAAGTDDGILAGIPETKIRAA